MRELLLTEEQYGKVATFFWDKYDELKKSDKLSDRKKAYDTMNCLDVISSVENTQYDDEYCGISIMITEQQTEELLCCLIDLMPFNYREEKK